MMSAYYVVAWRAGDGRRRVFGGIYACVHHALRPPTLRDLNVDKTGGRGGRVATSTMAFSHV